MGNKEIILTISTVKDFEKFLSMEIKYCVLIDFHIALLPSLIAKAHASQKKVFLHLDLMQGLSNDEAACEYACQYLQADGVISTKVKVVQKAMEKKRIGVLRLFLIDSRSLSKGIRLCQECKPDYVEVLPAIAPSILPKIQDQTGQKIMSGGLLTSLEEINACFTYGAQAVTISNRKLVDRYLKQKMKENANQ